MQAFEAFDKVIYIINQTLLTQYQDKSGKIDANELKISIGNQLTGLDEMVWKQMIKDADINGDSQIDFDEFMKMMYSLKETAKYFK